MTRREFSFKVENTTICFVQLYNDCWICSLPNSTAERLRQELLGSDLSVDELDVSTRIRNVFKAENFSTVHDVIQKTENELMKIPNFSRKSLKQLENELASKGFYLRRLSPR
jgi:DNA-directed RNA polymerase alpha subunit